MALTDHSAGLGVANGLSVERLRQQRTVLDTVQQGFRMKLFHGSEVDIRADGSLDYPDDMLSELDVVVASVHSAMGQSSEKMTARIISAMRNPHVTAIGHPTCRILGSRDPVQADMEALLQAAAETGTAMEINASPWRLDLRDTHITRARELGVPLIINTDSHATEEPEAMRFGVSIARRGWCEAHHILNTMPLERFQAFLSTPKPQRMRVFAGLE
jgi:DNA polymerase (family 10)